MARLIALALAAVTLGARPAASQALSDNGLHGRIALQDSGQFVGSDTALGQFAGAASDDALANIRLTWQPSWGPWSLQLHYVVSLEDGPDVRLAQLNQNLIREPPPTWFNLTDTFENHGAVMASQTIDRLAVGYATPQWVVRVGRQAITWGSGMVFRPMDLFDPFSPTATDTEYKPGVDMLYLQRLFADGSDLQLIVAPRPEHFGGAPTADASSIALHYSGNVLGHATTLLVARDHGDWVGGASVNGALGGATWNLELVPTFEHGGRTRISAVANISDAVTIAGRNTTVFAEYYLNGFGVTGSPFDLTDLPPDLLDRLARGQVFTLRRDYIAAGATVEVTPLLSASPSLIANLDDGGVYLLASATYSLSDNLVLIGGVQAPIGGRGTEYGGPALSPTNPTRLAPPSQIYLQLRRYF